VQKKARLQKKVDELTQVSCTTGRGLIREEVWVDSRNAVAKYNLAFINHQLYSGDNGRVLGYDNNHGQHHRHFMGKQKAIAVKSYEELLRKFLDEVREIRKWS